MISSTWSLYPSLSIQIRFDQIFPWINLSLETELRYQVLNPRCFLFLLLDRSMKNREMVSNVVCDNCDFWCSKNGFICVLILADFFKLFGERYKQCSVKETNFISVLPIRLSHIIPVLSDADPNCRWKVAKSQYLKNSAIFTSPRIYLHSSDFSRRFPFKGTIVKVCEHTEWNESTHLHFSSVLFLNICCYISGDWLISAPSWITWTAITTRISSFTSVKVRM